MTDVKQLQEKYVNYQMMEKQLQAAQEQLQKMDQQILELKSITSDVKGISTTETNKELLVPMSGGIFVKAKLDDNQKFLVNVGSSVVVEKDVKQTTELLNAQVREIESLRMEVLSQFHQLVQKSQDAEQELKELVEKVENV